VSGLRPAPTSRNIDPALFRYAALRSWHGFVRHRGIDSAATLSYFAALALFPAALSLVSAFALVDTRDGARAHLLDVLATVFTEDTVRAAREPLTQLLSIPNPAVALAVGLALALWTVSSYGTAFGRAVNTAYDLQEGRSFWKVRGSMLIVAAVILVAAAAIATILLGTPTVAAATAESLGWNPRVVFVWNVVKWPALPLLAFAVVALLYYFSPNVRHLRFRWVSWGALVAVIAWGVMTVGFVAYVTTVGQYDEVYGWVGAAIVTLLWLYLTNYVLVFGAELDAEIVRARQLAAGLPSEVTIQLPMRDTRRNLTVARHRAEDERLGREFREIAAASNEDLGTAPPAF
jgi:membrane protein